MRKWDRPAVSHDYPPDEYVRSRLGISFTGLFAVVVIGAGIVDFAVFGYPDTGIPYNYPLPFGVLYLVVSVWALGRFHSILDGAKIEILDVLDRTGTENGPYERAPDVSEEAILRGIHDTLGWAFHPAFVLGGGLIGGVFSVSVMVYLGAFQYYPYVLTSFLYGAGHGLFYAPIAGTVWILYQTPKKYVVDIDVLDPDGMGGYKRVGDGIVRLINIGIVLVTLDFVVLSSVMFVDEPVFQTAVAVLYLAMLSFLLLFTTWGVVRLRRRMIDLRQQKTTALRHEFSAVEDRYYEKLRNREDPAPESEHIETMTAMFDELHRMDLWPINLGAIARIGTTTAGSIVVAAVQLGFLGDPTAEWLFEILNL